VSAATLPDTATTRLCGGLVDLEYNLSLNLKQLVGLKIEASNRKRGYAMRMPL
jgi:hypothetical protein